MKSLPSRALFAALFALLLGLRLLSPTGFMPSFAHGGVAIVACPDAGVAPVHHDHDKPKHEQPCPYAAATALGTIGNAAALPADLAGFGIDWAFSANSQGPTSSHRLRPPATGPPILN